METFTPFSLTTEQEKASNEYARLEAAGIPVLLEHVELRQGSLNLAGYRLHVPASYQQTALLLLGARASSPLFFSN